MRRLIALISMPPPRLRPFVVFPAVLVISYTFFLAIEYRLAEFGLSPLVLAVVLAMGIAWAWQLPNLLHQTQLDRDALPTAVFFVLATLALLLFVHDPLWCQRVFTVFLSIRAIWLAYALWRAPANFRHIGGPIDGPKWFAESWARWKLISLMMLILISETAISYGTLTEWVVAWSVAPVVAYCMMYWSILATCEDNPDAE